ncbi:hypothetical protein C2845_PM05G00500 [Panicum miliaceum]|uniref:NADPH-dependent 1-acyldihydroxyacetone phosphate reductase-like n=1 Tax=Panicum miliaceum TaxID=4540 RepID=A0A3L6SWX6_PANMI|nr:hypothetical protein C2845_PM05G00500 [Panicum miliaceum]
MANNGAGASSEVAGDGCQQDGEAKQQHQKPVVLITGCAKGGIGYEYCLAFSALGCRVVATDIPDRVPDLADLVDLAGADTLPLDVTSESSVEAAVRRVLSDHGRIDVLVNNAGVGCTGPLAELRPESVRRAMDVNFLGQVRTVRAVAPHMARRGSGRVVNVGSVVGRAATPWAAPYCASKAAVHAATDALRLELRPFGVHVVAVVPGAVRSGLGRANAAGLAAAGRGEWRLYRGARPPREIVYGHMTLLFAALAAAPGWARDAFFARRFGLHKKTIIPPAAA